MATIDLQVSASADDAFENSGGNMLVTLTQGNVDAIDKFFGFRFQGVTIPAGATIDAAYLEVYLYHTNLDEPNHTIYAEDGASPAAFSSSSFDISGRTGTTASVTWSNADIGSTGFVQTPSLVSVIQELVDTYDYGSGAPMVLIIQGSADANRDLGVMHYDGDTTQAAKLHIEYTAGGGSAVTVNASPGAASVSGVTATVDAATTVSAGAATVQVNGIAASVQAGSVVTVNASAGIVPVSGVTATVNAAPLITAAAGVVQLVANAATVVAGGVTVQAAPGVAPVVGQRATIDTARYLYDLAISDEAAYQIVLSDEVAYSLLLSDQAIYAVELEDASRG